VPLYEYECGSCGKRFEVIQKFADAPLSVCKFCGGPVTRLVSSPAVHFKGTGWYVTDYARKSSTEASAPADGKSKQEEGKPAAASTETAKEVKPAADAPAAPSAKE
jgi:putative FmdB family regulatory protein